MCAQVLRQDDLSREPNGMNRTAKFFMAITEITSDSFVHQNSGVVNFGSKVACRNEIDLLGSANHRGR